VIENKSLWSCCQYARIEKNSEPMRFAAQIRAARALLGWSQTKLARLAGVGLATLQRIEQSEGVVKGNFATILKIQKTLEGAGISFSDDSAEEIGVRLLKKKT
jgi:transcriptional regulator with XRE-family HTH domain